MGCFDTIHVPCPKCQYPYAAQSKSGKCDFITYEIAVDVLSDVNRHAPFTCVKCEALFKVHLVIIATPVLILIGENHAEKDEDD